MNISFPQPRLFVSIAIVTMIAIAFLLPLPVETLAAHLPFNPAPVFAKADRFTTTINQDSADIYFPIPSHLALQRELLPVALILQGANVDKSNYSRFADILARYGFIAVVPNHLRRFPPVPGLGQKLLLPEQQQIVDVLAQMAQENSDRASPLFNSIDLDKLVLIGHSMGGVTGLTAIQGKCMPPFCFGSFTRPSALVGGIFYGTNLKGHFGQGIHPIENAGIPTALIQGTLDSESTPTDTEATYQQIQDAPKALVSIVGANHYGITNTNNPANPPGISPVKADPIAPTLDQEQSIESIARWSALFLRAYIMHDRGAFDYVHRSVDTESSCSILDSTGALTDLFFA